MKDLLNDIITAYSSLWSFKKRGNSIEIVTPVSTTNDVFVSVFLIMRGDEYVVTDGGWIDAGVYDIDEVNNIQFESIISHYKSAYGIISLRAKELTYFYKKTCNPVFVPNFVFDVSSFVGGIVNSSLAEVSRSADKKYNIFAREARKFLIQNVPDELILPRHYLKARFPSLNFGAAIKTGNHISLFNFSSGSCDSYYVNSLCKSKASFEIVHNDDCEGLFKNKIILLDDTSTHIRSRKVGIYVDLIRQQGICGLTMWSDRMSLLRNIV